MLVIHEALYFGDRLATTLLCPNQLRANGIRVNDMPCQFDKASTHSIHVKSTAEEEIVIPLTLDGVISYVADCTKPSEDDLANGRRVELTSDMEWTPYDNSFAEAKAVVKREVRDIQTVKTNNKPQIRNKGEGVRERGPILPMPIEFEDDALLVDRLIAAVKVAPDDISGDGLSGHENPDVYALTTTDRKIFALSSDEKRSIVTKNVLARRWGIGLSAAERTLQRTTQRGVRTFVHPTDRRVTASHPHLSHRLLKSTWYSDTVFAKVKSIRQNKCAQFYTDGKCYDLFYPLKSKALAPTMIAEAIFDADGIPRAIITDGAKEETGKQWKTELRKFRIKHLQTEPYSPWQNRAEGEYREIKRGIKCTTQRSQSPKRLWDFCGKWVTAIRRKTALDLPGMDGMCAEERVHNRIIDISPYAQFDWYEYVWFVSGRPTSDILQPRRQLGRWIGVAKDVGGRMTYYVLPKSCIPLPLSSVYPVLADERLKPEVQLQMAELDASIRERIGDDVEDEAIDDAIGVPQVPMDLFEDDNTLEPVEPEAAMPEADEYTPEAYDQYLAAELLLEQSGTLQKGVVKRRKVDDGGRPIGIRNSNPMLDTREYEVKFPDGSVDVLSANIVAESIYSQVDSEGNYQALLSEIMDH